MENYSTTVLITLVKIQLRKHFKSSIYDKANRIEERIEQLLNLHKVWINIVLKLYTTSVIADKLYTYQQNMELSGSIRIY